MSAEIRQISVQLRHDRANERLAEPVARVQPAAGLPKWIVEPALAVGRPIERAIVQQKESAVAGRMHVDLDKVGVHALGRFERGDGIFRRVTQLAAMGGNLDGPLANPACDGKDHEFFWHIAAHGIDAAPKAVFPIPRIVLVPTSVGHHRDLQFVQGQAGAGCHEIGGQ